MLTFGREIRVNVYHTFTKLQKSFAPPHLPMLENGHDSNK